MAERSLPPGFRFHPTDEELTMHYLKWKVCGKRTDDLVIGELDFYKFEPSDLPGLSVLRSRDPEWYFFSALDKKYPHGSRCNRTTKYGYWKATGKDREIKSGAFTVGMKKTLIYYVGRSPKGDRTDWIMHEYRLDEKYEQKINGINSYVLCRLRKKGGPGPRNGEQYGAPVSELSDDEATDGFFEVIGNALSLEQSEYLANVEQPWSAESHEDFSATDASEIDSLLSLLFQNAEEQKTMDKGSNYPADLKRAAETALPDILQIDIERDEKFHDLLHPLSDEAVILEQMLQFVTGKEEVSVDIVPESHVQDVSQNEILFGNGLMVDGNYFDPVSEPADHLGGLGDSVFEPTGGDQMLRRQSVANDVSTIPVNNLTSEKEIHLVGAANNSGSHSLSTEVSEELFWESSEANNNAFYDRSTFYSDIYTNWYSEPKAILASGLSNKQKQAGNEDLIDGGSNEAARFMSRDFDTEYGEVALQDALGQEERSPVEKLHFLQSIDSPPSPTSFVGVILSLLGDGPVLPASASELPVERKMLESQSQTPDSTSYRDQFSGTLTKRGNAGLSSPYSRKPATSHRVKTSSLHISNKMQFSSDKRLRKACGFLSTSLFWLLATILVLFCKFCTFSRSTCSL